MIQFTPVGRSDLPAISVDRDHEGALRVNATSAEGDVEELTVWSNFVEALRDASKRLDPTVTYDIEVGV